jgi:MSHA pilin protein MshB
VFIMKTLNVRKMSGAAVQAGFTIIELVVVILLLGILTATALPRFLDVTDEAHTAVVDGVVAGLNTGIGLYRAAWFASGQLPSNVPQFGPGTMDASAKGYPVGSVTNSQVISESADCVEIFNGLLQSGRPSVATAIYNATPATLEANIEAAASATTDFVVMTSSVPTGTPVASTGCLFYYVGQYKRGDLPAPTGTIGPARTIPLISYVLDTGEVTTSTLTLNLDP